MRAATISPSCIWNLYRHATPSHIGSCISSLLVTCKKGERILKLPFSFHALLCLHDTLFSFFFVVLLKNFPLKNRKHLLCFSLCTLRWIRRINWFSSSQTCCERAPENSSTTGFHQSEPAISASCRGLF